MKLYLHSLSSSFLFIPHFRTRPKTQDFLWRAFNKIPLSWYYLNCLTGTVFVRGSNLNTKMSTSCNKCFRDVASLCFKWEWRIKMMEAICKNMKNIAGHAEHIMGPLASVIFGTSNNRSEPLIGCGQAWKVLGLGIIDPEILIFSKVYFSHLEAILLHITELAASFISGSHCFISQ